MIKLSEFFGYLATITLVVALLLMITAAILRDRGL